MKVRTAKVIGLLLGLSAGSFPSVLSSYTTPILTLNVIIGVTSIILGQQIVKGVSGGLLFGFGIGFGLSGIIPTIKLTIA